ncbi:MAG: NAD kinase [Flavobacteriales bacterium]|nr:NAD kinase [Flavobacteriales bacterium]
MILAIYGRKFEDKSISMVNLVIDELEKRNTSIWIYEKFHRNLEKTLNRTIDAKMYNIRTDVTDNIEVLITIGGDGTILDVVTEVQDTGVPILGMNTGRLGFLANTSREDVIRAIDCLYKGKYLIDKRSVLELSSNENLFKDYNFALNELSIHKKDSSSMVTVHTYVNDAYLNSYWADGLIVATPTGSTAYSLSCGGPIMAPSSNNFVITPIAPHNLNVRPIILNDSNTIKLQIEGRENEYLATLDSRSEIITNETIITIKKAAHSINMVKFEWHTFFDTIRNKLLWGRDKRN